MARFPLIAVFSCLCSGCAAPWLDFRGPIDGEATVRHAPPESSGSLAAGSPRAPDVLGKSSTTGEATPGVARASLADPHTVGPHALSSESRRGAAPATAKRSAAAVQTSSNPAETDGTLLRELSQLPPHYRDLLRDQLHALNTMEAAHSGEHALPSAAPAPNDQRGEERPALATLLPGPDQIAVTANRPRYTEKAADAVRNAGFTAPAPASASIPSRAVAVTDRPVAESNSRQNVAVAEPVDRPAVSEIAAAGDAVDEPQTGAWRNRLEEVVQLLERELAQMPRESAGRATLQPSVRLLHVLANHPEQAVAEIEQLPADEQEFWKHLMHGLLLALDADGKNAASRRAALALRELRSASDHLANISSLDVRNLALCQKVDSYGQFTEFAAQSFRAGQEVLLYVEIDNFAVKPVGDKFETELRAAYDIVDATGQRVKKVELPIDKQLGNNRRRDYFVSYLINLPQDLGKGTYTLQLTMEDVKGQKSSQASIEFRIR